MITIQDLDAALATLNGLKQQTKIFGSNLSSKNHTDAGVSLFLERSKKLTLQGLDLFSALDKQLLLLKGELRNVETKEKYDKQRTHDKEQYEQRQIKRRELNGSDRFSKN